MGVKLGLSLQGKNENMWT